MICEEAGHERKNCPKLASNRIREIRRPNAPNGNEISKDKTQETLNQTFASAVQNNLMSSSSQEILVDHLQNDHLYPEVHFKNLAKETGVTFSPNTEEPNEYGTNIFCETSQFEYSQDVIEATQEAPPKQKKKTEKTDPK